MCVCICLSVCLLVTTGSSTKAAEPLEVSIGVWIGLACWDQGTMCSAATPIPQGKGAIWGFSRSVMKYREYLV